MKIQEAFKFNVIRNDGGREIIAEKPYSALPSDNYLTVVLAIYMGQFVTWVCNHSGKERAYHYGHYFEQDFAKAYDDFVDRNKDLIMDTAKFVQQA